MNTNNRPAACVCLLSGHCFACLAAGRRCSLASCRSTCADGVKCGSSPRPAAPRAPAMPTPVLEDGTADESIPPARVCTTSDGLVAALRASLHPAPTPPALLTTKEREARKERHEERAQLGRIRASTESYPARALTLDDLDAHERARFSMRRV